MLVLGEAPGAQEVRTGVPFVGPSGHLLWQILKQLGVEREQTSVTNALLCQIPSSQAKSGGALRGACTACRPRLQEDIEFVDPKVILPLGGTALQALRGKYSLKITQERGRAFRLLGETGPWVVPALHPAAILRGPGDFKRLATDIRYAVHLMNGGEPKDPGVTQFKVVTSEDAFEQATSLLGRQALLAADIETSDLNPRKHWIQYLGICWTKNKVAIFPREYIPRLAPLFANPNITWVWHNGKFDTSFLQQLGLRASTDEDTMLLHYLLDEVRGTHDLKQLSSDLLGAQDYDSVVKRYVGKGENGWAAIPPNILIPYLARDADYTLQIHKPLRDRVRKVPQLEELYTSLIIPASQFLQRVEANGIWVSLTHLEKVAEALAVEKEEIEASIQEVVDPFWNPSAYVEAVDAKSYPTEFNPQSPKQVSWVLYSQLRLRVPGKAGVRDTREETLEALPRHPFVKLLLRLRKVNKNLQTYAEGILREVEPDGRVHSTYLLHGTVTGRLSSRGPNLQNIPRNALIRDIFQAPPGRILVDVDFDQAELRMLAHLSRDEDLLDIYRSGRKLHDEVATDLYGPDYTDEQRMRAKAVNFGIVYGRTEFGLMHEFNVSLHEAQRMVHDWFARFPEAHRYINQCRQAPLQGKQLVSPFGRRRRFPFVPDSAKNEIQNEAANFAISSGASDVTLLTAMGAEDELRAQDALIVNLVHDSILVECPDDRTTAQQVFEILQESAARVVRDKLHGILDFPMDAKIGRGWGSAMKGDSWWQYQEQLSELPQ